MENPQPPQPQQPPQRERAMVLCLTAAALLVLVWGALPFLPGQIDDSFIVFAYAHHVVDYGEIAWNTGVRVEAYSSPVHLLLMVLGALAGVDLSVFARVVALVAAIGTLLLLVRRGAGGAWTALFLAAWQPFQYWAVAELETSLASLVGALGWSLVFRSRRAWAVGALVLMVYSLTRPEGVAWLAAGLLLRARYPRGLGAPEGMAIGGLALLLSYHVARVTYFGEVFPTPWLVKIVAVDGLSGGGREAALELVSAMPLVLLVVAIRRGVVAWVWLPLAIQTALLIRAGGDWMGNGRFLLPGVVASVAGALVAGAPRPGPRWAPFALLPLAALSFAWEPAQMQAEGPRWRDGWFLKRPLAALETPWSAPLLDEVAFLIRRIPVGAGVEISDVGLPGNLDDIRIWDAAGLTDRVVAEIIAAKEPGMSAALTARYADPTAIWCVRYGIGHDGEDPGDDWMKALFPDVATRPDARGLFWRCREGGEPAAEVRTGRWSRLLARFPIQDGIRWQYGRALLAEGRVDDAVSVARGATWVGTDADGWVAFDGGRDAYAPGRGWPLYGAGERTTAELPESFWATRALSLDVDDPGTEGALASIHWQPECGLAEVRTIVERSRIPVPNCDSTGSRRLVVQFLNDDAHRGFDRNLYVTLVPTASPTLAP